jgi:tRNA (guanine37-N1)-methyltransferase
VLNKQDTDFNFIMTDIIANEKEKENLSGELKTIIGNAKLNISSLEVKEIPVDLKYENFNYDHCIRKILPPGSKDIPSSYELIGKIAHMNLREEYLPYKKIIGRMLLDV